MKTPMEMLAEKMGKAREKLDAVLKKYKTAEGFNLAEFTKSADDVGAVETSKLEIKTLQTEYDILTLDAENQAGLKFLNEAPAGKSGSGVIHPSTFRTTPTGQMDSVEEYKEYHRYAGLKFFQGQNAERKAYRFGKWFLGSVMGWTDAKEYCTEHGIEIKALDQKAHQEGANASGGFLVPPEFDNTMIDLRETFGRFRNYARIVPMMSDTKFVPRRAGGLTAYYIGESKQLTESQKGWDRVGLVARKLAVLTKYSSELEEDIIINIADDLAGEMAYAFSIAEDQAGFNGDGSGTYGRIVGVRNTLLNIDPTPTNVKGIVVGSGNSWAALTLADFQAVIGRLPQYADTPNCRWFVHRTFYFTVMEKLALAAGGVTSQEVFNTSRGFRFLGYPVEFCQALPKTTAASQLPVFFGDLRLACMFGDRRQLTIAMSEHAFFETDEIGLRGTERYDVNVHDVGDTVDPGPIIGLMTSA